MKKQFIKKCAATVALGFIGMGQMACQDDIATPHDSTSATKPSAERVADYTLRSVADFTMGVHEDSYIYDADAVASNLMKTEFDRITTQQMKMSLLQNTKGTYTWANLDKEVKFASDNGKTCHGHTLIYWVSSPNWFKNPTSKATFEADAQSFIKTTVRRYEGKVVSIDVANELFQAAASSWSTDGFNNVQTWRNLYSSDDEFIRFIGRCFQWAREADNEVNGTNMKLFYNDYYHEAYTSKRDAILNMCKKIRDFGYPIDGIGMQFHVNVATTTYAGITDAINTAKNLTAANGSKFLVHIAELDIRMNEPNQTSSTPPAYGTFEQWKQYDMARHVAATYRLNVPAAQKWGITMWNTTDDNSWFRLYNGDYDYPTLFNDAGARKTVYYGLLSGLSSAGQYFVPERNFHFKNINSGKYAEVAGNSTANAAAIQQNAYNSGNYQKFQFFYNNNGFYEIRNVNSAKSFDHFTTTPFSLQQYAYGSGNNQQFSLVGIGNGQFRIRSKANSNALQVTGGSTANAARLQLGTESTTSNNQKWELVD
jgi:endo-1,4-beta-xylanase